MTVCIVDTSVLCELLGVPGKHDRERASEVSASFTARAAAGQAFILPFVVLVETGNHVAQASGDRYELAKRFRGLATKALTGQSPFTVTDAPTIKDVEGWLSTFPEDASRGVGLADRSIIAVCEHQRALHAPRLVYIWSFDAHLAAYGDPEA
jgi:hypothetical protein